MLSNSYLSQNISAFPLPLKIIHVHCTYLTGYRHGYRLLYFITDRETTDNRIVL